MLELIEKYLQMSGIRFGSLKGNMAVGKRQKMIDEFNQDPDCRVFCASLLAGGVGIDLTSAQAVIHYDRWWNPAREEQATARVHRMGQKNVVQVFRLITKGTLEEKIHQLITKKRELATISRTVPVLVGRFQKSGSLAALTASSDPLDIEDPSLIFNTPHCGYIFLYS
jgi:SNF2 family DNA or RNA helicase